MQRLAKFSDFPEGYTLDRQSHDIGIILGTLHQLLDENDKLNFAVNYLRLPLGIDPDISNLDTVKLLNAFQIALDRLDPPDA